MVDHRAKVTEKLNDYMNEERDLPVPVTDINNPFPPKQ